MKIAIFATFALQTIFSLKCIFNDAFLAVIILVTTKGSVIEIAPYFWPVSNKTCILNKAWGIRRHNKETPAFEFIDTLQTVAEQIVKLTLKQILVILNLLLCKKL